MVTVAALKLEVDASGMTAGVNQAAQSATRAEQSIGALAGRLDTLSDEIRNSYNQAGLGATAAAERAAAAAQRWAISEENAAKRANAAIDANIQTSQRLAEAIDQVAAKIDAIGSRSLQGPRRVGEELDGTATKALKLNRAIEAVGEVTQVGSRVRLLGEEIRGLGSGFGSASGVAAAFSGALIDVAQISEKTGGSLRALGVVLRANPILAAAGVISLIASAMSLFGSNTDKTTGSIREQVVALTELQRAATDAQTQLRVSQELLAAGFELDPRQVAETRSRALAEQIAKLPATGNIALAELSKLTNVSQSELVRRAPAGGVSSFPQLDSQRTSVPIALTNDAAREVLREIARELRVQSVQQPTIDQVPQRIPEPPVYGPFPIGSGADAAAASLGGRVGYGSAIGPQAAGLSPFEQGRLSNDIADAARASAEFEERLRALRDLGNDVGSALGNAFGSLVLNINNGRQALVGLLQQLSAIGQQQITRGFGNAFANLFAPSPTQATTNANMTGFGPQPAPGFQP